jgi:hypothetical protein
LLIGLSVLRVGPWIPQRNWVRLQKETFVIWLRNIIARSANVKAKPNRDRAATIVFLLA